MSEELSIGSIVVDKAGTCLVQVWPNESEDSRCFTGVNLFDGDCSVMWLRSNFERCNLFKAILLRRYRGELRNYRNAAKFGREFSAQGRAEEAGNWAKSAAHDVFYADEIKDLAKSVTSSPEQEEGI